MKLKKKTMETKETMEMKENRAMVLKILIGAVLLVLILIGIMYYMEEKPRIESRKIARERDKERTEYIEKANKALNQGDFSTAYGIVDQMIAKGYGYEDAGRDLNKKILTNEIAANIENANAAKIIMCIKERAMFNSGYDRTKNEQEMLEHAIQLAITVDDDKTAAKLQKALDYRKTIENNYEDLE